MRPLFFDKRRYSKALRRWNNSSKWEVRYRKTDLFTTIRNKEFDQNGLHSRTQISTIKVIPLENQSTGGTRVWNRFHGDTESISTAFYTTKIYCQFWHLLFHWFRTRFISTAISILVNFQETHIIIHFFMSLFERTVN